MAFDAGARSIVLRRCSQHVIEFVLLTLAAVLSLVLGLLLSLPLIKLGLPPKVFFVLPWAAVIAVALLGTLWMEIWYPHRHDGSTPAMRWLGIRITTLRGGRPSLRDYFVRWLLMSVDGLLLGLVGLVLMVVTPRNQRLGDMVARTVVVRRPTADRRSADRSAADQGAVSRPARDQPTGDRPTTEQPVADQRTADLDTVSRPATDQSIADQPGTEQPVADQAIAHQPAARQRVADSPTVDRPATDRPTADHLATDQPIADRPAKQSADDRPLT
ncbi:Uncharacterized membrane protein YckC, RDD family [Lentzea xinjiangensis]|uniref:Uncharacterized membrane protein YckC, RDD family n=1 Tax=Lentzea xinjiangensis TaxID=402600 RepID=A0A1H9JZZ9_9PSEU|nr:RDD family protein [Lentzea xinjiangensis]SEQ92233.1 Uncharacterized membrane protein YckC, RDD family [Lentzea xinjiangensis]